MLPGYRFTVHHLPLSVPEIILIVLLLVSGNCFAYFQDEEQFKDDLLFSNNDPIEISIAANFRSLFNDRGG